MDDSGVDEDDSDFDEDYPDEDNSGDTNSSNKKQKVDLVPPTEF